MFKFSSLVTSFGVAALTLTLAGKPVHRTFQEMEDGQNSPVEITGEGDSNKEKKYRIVSNRLEPRLIHPTSREIVEMLQPNLQAAMLANKLSKVTGFDRNDLYQVMLNVDTETWRTYVSHANLHLADPEGTSPRDTIDACIAEIDKFMLLRYTTFLKRHPEYGLNHRMA
jgi:hypothetical protein